MRLGRAEDTAVRRQHVYCTYFDRNYLDRGLALWWSLRNASPAASLWICCLDDEVAAALRRLSLPGVRLFGLAELERRFPDLLKVKPARSRIEYYFTCTPFVVRFVLDAAADIAEITYVDADLYFFADPEPLFRELDAAGGSIGIIPHRFSDRLKEREVYGIYNVGWLTFSRDDKGLTCLDDWCAKCLEWCHDRAEDGKFADQKYLDTWPERFASVVVLQHKGANVALWNLDCATVRKHSGRVVVAGDPLIFYHFHGISAVNSWLFRIHVHEYGVRLSRLVQRRIYRPYLVAWRRAMRLVDAVCGPSAADSTVRRRRDCDSDEPLGLARKVLSGVLGVGGGEYLMIWPCMLRQINANSL